MDSYVQKSVLKRILFSLFLAGVAAGISFYLITFCGAIVAVYFRGVEMANAPGLDLILRRIALPIVALLALVVFAAGMKRPRAPELPQRHGTKRKPATSEDASRSVLLK